MINNVDFISIRVILDRLLRHPLLNDLTLEAAVQYAIDFIGTMGLPATYREELSTIEVKDYRGLLPCEIVAVNQVRQRDNGVVYGAMMDNFNTLHTNGIRYATHSMQNPTFRTSGRVIHTSIKDTVLDISYKTLNVDEDGFPLIPDNSIFLKTLELYIKKEWFTILFDMGKISPAVLHNTQQEYYFKAGQCNNEFIIPSVSEMEALTNSINQLIPRQHGHATGFKYLGAQENIRKH